VLILTTVDSSQIICGKWRAIVQRQWRRYVLLGIMRGLIFTWIMLSSYYSLYSGFNAPFGGTFFWSQRAVILLIIGFILAVTLLNLGFTAAVGLSASVDHRSSAIALARAFGTRMVVLLTVVLIPLAIAYFLRLYYLVGTVAGTLGTAIGMVLVTMVDNGVTVSYELMTTSFFRGNLYYADYGMYYLVSSGLAILAAPLLYVVLTWGVLRFAAWRAVRAGALRTGQSVSSHA
jgi:hypothetical protein